MLEAAATAHSVGTNPVELPKTRATAGDPALVEAALAEVGEVVAGATAVAVEVVEEEAAAVAAVAEEVDDDASWRFGPPGSFAIGSG